MRFCLFGAMVSLLFVVEKGLPAFSVQSRAAASFFVAQRFLVVGFLVFLP